MLCGGCGDSRQNPPDRAALSPGPVKRLLENGGEIQEVIARLHGRQRAGLGWTADALAREWAIMTEVVSEAVREALPHSEIEEAIRFLAGIVLRAERISRRSLQQASPARRGVSQPQAAD